MNAQRRILIIENDRDTLFLLANALARSGYQVESCEAGAGLVEFKHEIPDLYILDKGLPTIDGLALSKFLRLQPQTKEVPIIMISGEAVRMKAWQAGIDDFIMKPFSIRELLRAVDKHLAGNYAQQPMK